MVSPGLDLNQWVKGFNMWCSGFEGKASYVTEIITDEGGIIMGLGKHGCSMPTSMQVILHKYVSILYTCILLVLLIYSPDVNMLFSHPRHIKKYTQRHWEFLGLSWIWVAIAWRGGISSRIKLYICTVAIHSEFFVLVNS